MYVNITDSSNNKDVYIYQSYRKENGKTSSKIYRKLGKYNDLLEQFSGNHDALMEYLSERMEEYKGITFTEDSKAAAKSTIAELRKEKKAFQDRVKEVKAEYMAPFEKFWKQAAELIEMYDEPIRFINSQVEAFEKKRIEEKKQLIIQLYEECISDMQDFLPLAKLYNPKWENATTTQKAIREELMIRKEAAKSAIAAIKEMNSEVEELALNMYKETFDLILPVSFLSKVRLLQREEHLLQLEYYLT